MRRVSGVDQVVVQVTRTSAAARIADSVISWNTIRLTGMRGFNVSSRCQAMASPSRSPSVAR